MLKTKRTISWLLLVLFASYYASTNCFFHSHNFTNGVVTHSHPYTSGTHTHSTNTLLLIDNLTILLFVGGGVIFISMLFAVSKARVYTFYRQRTLDSLIGCNLLRAQPALV